MEWYEILGFVVGFTVVLLWQPKHKSPPPDEHIEWSGDNICLKRKQYPTLDDDFRETCEYNIKDVDAKYKLEPEEKDDK